MGHGLDLAPEMRQLNYLSLGIPGLFLAHDLKISLSVSFFFFQHMVLIFNSFNDRHPSSRSCTVSARQRSFSVSHHGKERAKSKLKHVEGICFEAPCHLCCSKDRAAVG